MIHYTNPKWIEFQKLIKESRKLGSFIPENGLTVSEIELDPIIKQTFDAGNINLWSIGIVLKDNINRDLPQEPATIYELSHQEQKELHPVIDDIYPDPPDSEALNILEYHLKTRTTSKVWYNGVLITVEQTS